MGVGVRWKVDIVILINIIILIIINLFESEVEEVVEEMEHITNPSEMVEMEMKTGMEMKRRIY